VQKVSVLQIKESLLSFKAINQWPELLEVVQNIGNRQIDESVSSIWDNVTWACNLVGGTTSDSYPGVVSTFCIHQAVKLVDDILDSDSSGLYHRLGTGTVSNMALTWQALGSQALLQSHLKCAELQYALDNFNKMVISTSIGQNADLHVDGSEESYWKAVDMKTPPMFSSAFFVGAMLGGATREVASQISLLGAPVGRFTQIHDDLSDILSDNSGSPDWYEPHRNIGLLYCCLADYPQKARFLELIELKKDTVVIKELQRILLKSGALSYSCYRLLAEYKSSLATIEIMPNKYRIKSIELLRQYLNVVVELMSTVGHKTTIEELVKLLHTSTETHRRR